MEVVASSKSHLAGKYTLMREPDICANQTLDAMAVVCNGHVATCTGISDDTGFTLVCLDDKIGEVNIVHADTLMDAVVGLSERLGIDWADI